MSDIIKKLGIKPIDNYGWVKPDNQDDDLCMVSAEDLGNLEQQKREMITGLIDACDTFEVLSKVALLHGEQNRAGRRENDYQKLIYIIEKICYPLTWSEIVKERTE